MLLAPLQPRNEQGLLGLAVELVQEGPGLTAPAESNSPKAIADELVKTCLGPGEGNVIRRIELMTGVALTIHYDLDVHGELQEGVQLEDNAYCSARVPPLR